MHLLATATAPVGNLKWGAFAFGTVIGWNLYFINRYRKASDISLSDVATLLSAVGGSAVLALFPAKTVLFGYYGTGLAVGFFVYFIVIVVCAILALGLKPGLTWILLGDDKHGHPTFGADARTMTLTDD